MTVPGRARRSCHMAIWLIAVATLAIVAPAARGTPPAEVNAAIDRGDYAEALRRLQPLAEQGDADAQYHLGLLHQNGQGVPRDAAQAAGWFRKAALQGHAEARYSLGTLYATGQGVSRSDAEASRWLRLAARQGLAVAAFDLGLLYASGQGVKHDDVQAYVWFAIAASRFAPAQHEQRARALHERDVVASRLAPAALAEGQRQAAVFQPALQ
ncbi:MAG: sel1 repeat family protein [Alphaproteobacteria bacterium]|nr:sel1 repeat family protein [Alphaproteobacteria bacterium]